MSKQKKLYSLIISAIIVAILSATTAVFAYFAVESGWLKSPNITATANGEIVEISSEYQLRKWAVNEKYNSKELTSEQSSRHTIKLVADIELSKEIVIERDCNLDLNGHILLLNEFNMIFRHDFAAKMMVFDSADAKGKIDGTGKIIFKTPNCIVDIEESLSPFASVVQYNAQALTEDIIELAFSRIKDCVKVDELGEKSLIGYYKNDVELIQTYKHYENLNLLWIVENEDTLDQNIYLTSLGELVKMPQKTTFLNLKLQINYGGSLVGEGQKQIAIVPDSAVEDRTQVAKNHIAVVLQKLKNGEEYLLLNDLALPKHLEYYGVDFEYIAEPNCLIDNGSDFTLSKPYSVDYITLTVKYLVDGLSLENSDDVFEIVCKNRQDNSEKIDKLFDELGVLIINNKGATCPLWTSDILASYGVASVSYAFVETVQNQSTSEDIPASYYGVRAINASPLVAGGDQEIFVNSLPNSAKKVYLVPTITFLEGEPISVSNKKVQVHYVVDSAGGDEAGNDPFAYYYKQVEDLLAEATHLGETYLSFLMPNKILDTVYVQYSLMENVDNLVLQTDDLSTLFNIDTQNLPVDNTNVRILFKFAYAESEDGELVTPDWATIPYYGQVKDDETGIISGDAKYYPFVMSGIIRNNFEGIVDAILYETILEQYSLSDIDPEVKVLTRNEVSTERDALLVEGKSSIQTYNGIQYLTNTAQLISKQSNFQNGDMQYLVNLKKMTSITINFGGLNKDCLSFIQALDQVKMLDLSCNNLSGITDFSKLNNIEKLILSNCGLDNLDIFKVMFGVEELNVSNEAGQSYYPNQIKSFRPLMEIENLKIVYLQNIAVDGDTQNYWGSTGMVNLSVLVMLVNKRGVQVYNTSETVAFVPLTAQITATNLVENFVYVGKITLKQNQNTIEMPTTLDNGSYNLNWVCLSSGNAVSVLSDGVLTFDNPLTAGHMELLAFVTVNGQSVGRLVSIDFVGEVMV